MNQNSADQLGRLYVVATPIGNFEDITARALRILQQVSLLLVEDSRQSGKLLQHFGIRQKMRILHDHNESQSVDAVIDMLRAGKDIAIISDAGTPLISDPGYKLVHYARTQGIAVVPVPGASAVIAALSVSGLATDRFCFEGFLPAKRAARQQQLQGYVAETRTLIFYEAPHRIVPCLEDMEMILGQQRQAVLARELTKTFETVKKASIADLLTWVRADPNQQKGEIVLLLAGRDKKAMAADELPPQAEKILDVLLKQLSLKQAVQLTVEMTGLHKKKIYRRALEKQQK